MGGMGGPKNEDILVQTTQGWEECCTLCIKHSAAVSGEGTSRAEAATACTGWTYFKDKSSTCHLHANADDQHPGLANRLTGVLLAA